MMKRKMDKLIYNGRTATEVFLPEFTLYYQNGGRYENRDPSAGLYPIHRIFL